MVFEIFRKVFLIETVFVYIFFCNFWGKKCCFQTHYKKNHVIIKIEKRRYKAIKTQVKQVTLSGLWFKFSWYEANGSKYVAKSENWLLLYCIWKILVKRWYEKNTFAISKFYSICLYEWSVLLNNTFLTCIDFMLAAVLKNLNTLYFLTCFMIDSTCYINYILHSFVFCVVWDDTN